MSNPIEGGSRPHGPAATQPGKGHKASGDAAQPDPAPAAGSSSAAATDGAEASERLQAVRERIDQSPEVDQERVNAIKQRIADGDYPIDAEKVARKFAELEALIEGEQ
ncbi:flagellar biosynthesis anti-sigma factor FlgM [Halorhodospira neutriphila]|uniref:Negative regulator of flagellin synthesis n=1 Tax=Halorhodospira neutriphila TaxID=168379 RepID=A0ABS1E7W7_9GAMM|nr:flagellar biosynthesis anti-sigma factor FlgM [Halorhodospira neutriphila]MBK1726929.1 flagellar biosynthesis anti-sigma factor FlgM [Halorhodospira neutriphila]